MCRCCLRKEIVLVAWCIQVLVLLLGRLYVLSPGDLYLDVRPVSHLLSQVLLLARRTVKVLRGLVHYLVSRCTSHGEVHMLS